MSRFFSKIRFCRELYLYSQLAVGSYKYEYVCLDLIFNRESIYYTLYTIVLFDLVSA